MVSQMWQGTVLLLLEQGRAFLRRRRGLLIYASVRGASRRDLRADGVAPLTVVRRARTLILCVDMKTERQEKNPVL